MGRIWATYCLAVLIGLCGSACSQRDRNQGLDTVAPSYDTSASDTPQPEVLPPEDVASDVSGLDLFVPDMTDADTGGADGTEPDLTVPDVNSNETTDLGAADSDVVEPDSTPDAADSDALDPDSTLNCIEATDCGCFVAACVGLETAPDKVCALLVPLTACYDKLVLAYQGGACEEKCGGIGGGLLATICGDPDCAEFAVSLEGLGALPTQCPGCACQPSCGGIVCGDDGCGGSCGQCLPGAVCDAGVWVAVAPKTCEEVHGRVGCCYDGDLYWFENGALQGGVGSCAEEPCGWKAANSFYACGNTGADPSGTYPLDCFGVNPAPEDCAGCSCDGKSCGDDGCGASCGACSAGLNCSPAGQCLAPGPPVCKMPSGCAELDPCDCVSCSTDGACSLDDDCICPDCATDGFCSAPANCVSDGLCDMYNEGCHCFDCMKHPTCIGS